MVVVVVEVGILVFQVRVRPDVGREKREEGGGCRGCGRKASIHPPPRGDSIACTFKSTDSLFAKAAYSVTDAFLPCTRRRFCGA